MVDGGMLFGILSGELLIEDVIGMGQRDGGRVEDYHAGAGLFDQRQSTFGVAEDQAEAVGIEFEGADMGDGLLDIGAGRQDRVQRGQREESVVAQRTGNAGHPDAESALVATGDRPDGAGEVEMSVGGAGVGSGGLEDIHSQLLFTDVVAFA